MGSLARKLRKRMPPAPAPTVGRSTGPLHYYPGNVVSITVDGKPFQVLDENQVLVAAPHEPDGSPRKLREPGSFNVLLHVTPYQGRGAHAAIAALAGLDVDPEPKAGRQ